MREDVYLFRLEARKAGSSYQATWSEGGGKPGPAFAVALPLAATELSDLRWYLEQGYSNPVRARLIAARLKDWGRWLFDALFGGSEGDHRFEDLRKAREAGGAVELIVVTDDPDFHAQPWELMRDRRGPLVDRGLRWRRQLASGADYSKMDWLLPRLRAQAASDWTSSSLGLPVSPPTDILLATKAADFERESGHGEFPPGIDKGVDGVLLSPGTIRLDGIRSTGPENVASGAEVFYFGLEGEKVRQNRVELGSDFDLIFAYGAPAGEVVSKVMGKEIERSRLRSEEFDLVLLPPPSLEFREGSFFSQRVRFTEGRLDGEVRFRLRAPAELPAADGKVRCWVRFSRQGRIFYQMPLDLELVEQLRRGDNAAYEAPNLDLDALLRVENSERRPREAQLVLRRERNDISICCSLLAPAQAEPELLEVRKFDCTMLETKMARLKGYLEGGSFDWAQAEGLLSRTLWTDAGARESLERFATAGYELYSFLTKDPVLARILAAIDDLPDGSALDIQTDNVFLPWEILNRNSYRFDWVADEKAESPLEPQHFWGYRFLIESSPLGEMADFGGAVAGGKGPPFVSVNVNPSIDEERDYRDRRPSSSHLQLQPVVEKRGRFKFFDDPQAVKQELSRPSLPATLIYLFCHGQRDQPFMLDGAELLDLGDGVKIEPGTLDTSKDFSARPIVMLNSCSSGAFSPLQFDSFLSVFRKRQACGMIATTFPVPTFFAAEFGQAVVAGYVQGQETIGELILGLRRQLIHNGNPLGLLYTVQCPLEARAPGFSEVRSIS